VGVVGGVRGGGFVAAELTYMLVGDLGWLQHADKCVVVVLPGTARPGIFSAGSPAITKP
jgi:hypothetical protein